MESTHTRDDTLGLVTRVRFLDETEIAVQIGRWFAKLLPRDEEDILTDEASSERPWIPKALITASDLHRIGGLGFVVIPKWLAEHNNLATTTPHEKHLACKKPQEGIWHEPRI